VLFLEVGINHSVRGPRFVHPTVHRCLFTLRAKEMNYESSCRPPICGPEVLKFEVYPDPAPGPGEVLVRVAATSVNPIDYKRRAGLTKDFYPIQFPGLIGVDIAGTVVKIGPRVEGFSAGDQVFAMAANT
jgi:hypothetical protein